jgi:hypothetical protein
MIIIETDSIDMLLLIDTLKSAVLYRNFQVFVAHLFFSHFFI